MPLASGIRRLMPRRAFAKVAKGGGAGIWTPWHLDTKLRPDNTVDDTLESSVADSDRCK